MASDQNKPNGQFVITPEMAPAFVESLPVGKFHGIGPATARKMTELGIATGLDLKAQPLSFLQERFGKAGAHYYWIARAVDKRPVQPDRVRKSVGAENTFEKDLATFEEMKMALVPVIDKVWRYCENSGVRGRTVTLKVKFSDFQQMTRSRTLTVLVGDRVVLEEAVIGILSALVPFPKTVRLLGVTLSALNTEEEPDNVQLALSL